MMQRCSAGGATGRWEFGSGAVRALSLKLALLRRLSTIVLLLRAAQGAFITRSVTTELRASLCRHLRVSMATFHDASGGASPDQQQIPPQTEDIAGDALSSSDNSALEALRSGIGSRFYEHYSGVHGERWPALAAALLRPARHVARVNRLVSPDSGVRELLEGLPGCGLAATTTAEHEAEWGPTPLCYVGPPTFPAPPVAPGGARGYYLMDLASVVAAVALDVRPGQRVADFCAAPGGKALVLAEMMELEGTLVCNDRSGDRKARLQRTLSDYLPEVQRKKFVQVTCRDASIWFKHEPQSYDRILVDAPCSSEKHLLQPDGASYLAQWGPQRTKRLGADQRALLSSAIRCLKPGGRVVYSTCSISPAENDAVVSKLLKRNPGVRLLRRDKELGPRAKPFIDAAVPGLERTECGWHILPDRCVGWGPIYFSVLEVKDE